jgi:hypothetical protein
VNRPRKPWPLPDIEEWTNTLRELEQQDATIASLSTERDETLAALAAERAENEALRTRLDSAGPRVETVAVADTGDYEDVCTVCNLCVEDHTWEDCARGLRGMMDEPCPGCAHWREELATAQRELRALEWRLVRDGCILVSLRTSGDWCFGTTHTTYADASLALGWDGK